MGSSYCEIAPEGFWIRDPSIINLQEEEKQTWNDQVYKFDAYFDESSTTHQVLTETEMVNYPEKVVNGVNCTVFGYG